MVRRAAGRNRYNAERRERAMFRRYEIAMILRDHGGIPYGIQARIARQLGVSESTVSRDIWTLLRVPTCRTCGQWLISPEERRLLLSERFHELSRAR